MARHVSFNLMYMHYFIQLNCTVKLLNHCLVGLGRNLVCIFKKTVVYLIVHNSILFELVHSPLEYLKPI